MERGAAGGLDALPFRLHQQAQEIIELGVGDGALAGDEIGHDPGDKAGGAGAGQAVGLGLTGETVVPDVGLFKFLGRHAQQDRGALGRLDKEAVDVVAVEPLETIAHAARRPAHPGGDVDDEGVGLIHSNALFLQLGVQPLGGHGVAQEEGDGFLVVHKIAGGVGLGALPPLLHGAGVVVGILDDLHALAPQQVLLPLLRVGAHVDDDPEAQGGAHDADGEAQVARGADLHGVAAQELLHGLPGKGGVVVRHGDLPGGQGQILCVLQNFIDAAAGLDGPGDVQMAVFFEQQAAGDLPAVGLLQGGLHLFQLSQGGLDQAVVGLGLREGSFQKRRKPGQPRLSVGDVRLGHHQVTQAAHQLEGDVAGILPDGLFADRQVGHGLGVGLINFFTHGFTSSVVIGG